MEKLPSNGHGEGNAYDSIACIWFIYSTAEETARNHLLLPELVIIGYSDLAVTQSIESLCECEDQHILDC